MSTISVIVPVYQAEKYLCQCVDSILDQSFRDFELILVDDGSPDGCGAICDAYALQDQRILVIHQDNKGLSAARNAGIDWIFAHSDSRWITFVDSDDWIHPEMLERLLEASLKLNSPVSVGFYQQTHGQTDFWSGSPASPVLCKPDELFLSNLGAATVAWGKLYRRECFQDIRYHIGKIHEDEFITYRILFAHAQVAVINYPFYAYRINPQGIMRSPWTPKRLALLEALEQQMRFFYLEGYRTILVLRMNTYVGACIHSLIRLFRRQHRKNHSEQRRVIRNLLLALWGCVREGISLSPLLSEYRHWIRRKLHTAHK